MKKISWFWLISILFTAFIFMTGTGFADDTCVFGNETETVRPNIILLLDTGAEMAEVTPHPDYDSTIDYMSLGMRIISLAPDAGSTTAGNEVTIIGSDFPTAENVTVTVTFDGVAATNVDVVSGTKITCSAPAGSGTVDVTVSYTLEEVTTTATKADAYSFGLVVMSLNPQTVNISGGTVVDLNGRNFEAGATIKVDGFDVGTVTLVTSSQLQFTAPAKTEGTYDVVVTQNSVEAALTGEDGLAYSNIPAPVVTSITENTGAEGDTVTIAGSNFQEGATVTFGDADPVSATFESETKLTAISVPALVGETLEVSVVVTNPDGQSSNTDVMFTYEEVTTYEYTITAGKNDVEGFDAEDIIFCNSCDDKTITATVDSITIGQTSATIIIKSTAELAWAGNDYIEEPGGETAKISSITLNSGDGGINSTGGSGAGEESSDAAYSEDMETPLSIFPVIDSEAVSNEENGMGVADPPAGEVEGETGFFNELGYCINGSGNLVPVNDDLTVPTSGGWAPTSDITASSEDGNDAEYAEYTFNGNPITLPIRPCTKPLADSDYPDLEIKDNATALPKEGFRYSRNYLNWLYFSGEYTGNGSDLPDKSRLYYAKRAIFRVAQLTENRVQYSIYHSSGEKGATQAQPWALALSDVDKSIITEKFTNNINNMVTVHYSPLAEMLASAGGYFTKDQMGGDEQACADNFIILVSSGRSSHDLKIEASPSFPGSMTDSDSDSKDAYQGGSGVGEVWDCDNKVYLAIPMNEQGSTYADDVAHYLYNNPFKDSRTIITYTVGYAEEPSKRGSELFMKSIAAKGNGLYDPSDDDPEADMCNNDDYIENSYYSQATSPDKLEKALWESISAILNRTNTFTAPVVPVTRNTSGNIIYMAFFKPSENVFWEGNLTKFGLSDDMVIQDKDRNDATWPNGALKDTAEPYWQVQDWATVGKSNYIDNISRTIYTHRAGETNLIDFKKEPNTTATNEVIDLVGPVTTDITAANIIDYVRGVDVLDEDKDSDVTENRAVITGDILHSEPAVVRYTKDDRTTIDTIRVFYAANDGMLHAVTDSPDLDNPLDTDGQEAWAFIPNDQLERLGMMLDDTKGHQFYIDSSPKVYIDEIKPNRYVDPKDDTVDPPIAREKAYLVCGQRKGGQSYFCLDISDPDAAPVLKWTLKNGDIYDTDKIVILGETWSEPTFGKIKVDKDDDGTLVCFLGGGYQYSHDADNDPNTPDVTVQASTFLVVNLATGAVIKQWKYDSTDMPAMAYSFPSAAFPVDSDNDDDGFTDKVYIGDTGGQMWRFAGLVDDDDKALNFPDTNPNITKWTAEVIFKAPKDDYKLVDDTSDDIDRKFFYPPTVTLEPSYDLVFMTTGDRDNPCDGDTSDKIYAVADNHSITTDTAYTEDNLVDVTTPKADGSFPEVTIGTGEEDKKGWYITLDDGEKALSEGTVFYGVYYVTTFKPDTSVCAVGGTAKLWGVAYKTGASVSALGFTGDDNRSTSLGGGIPSKPVLVLTNEGSKLLISVGSTDEDQDESGNVLSLSTGAGVATADPLMNKNFFELSWEEIY